MRHSHVDILPNNFFIQAVLIVFIDLSGDSQ